MSKTQMRVDLQDMGYSRCVGGARAPHGDQLLGMAPSAATALTRWDEQHGLVCTFESVTGRSNNTYSWMPAFLIAAVEKHLELFGEEGRADLPESLLSLPQTCSPFWRERNLTAQS